MTVDQSISMLTSNDEIIDFLKKDIETSKKFAVVAASLTMARRYPDEISIEVEKILSLIEESQVFDNKHMNIMNQAVDIGKKMSYYHLMLEELDGFTGSVPEDKFELVSSVLREKSPLVMHQLLTGGITKIDALIKTIIVEPCFEDVKDVESRAKGFVTSIQSKALTEEEAFLLYLDVEGSKYNRSACISYLGMIRARELGKVNNDI